MSGLDDDALERVIHVTGPELDAEVAETPFLSGFRHRSICATSR
jgi:hypothetical protein